jgi:O-antigen/teichoic acid export membrane protein
VPEHQRYGVLAGMRWSLWLSVLAVPFSLGTNLLLARVGPETIGVYGLLSVYVALTSCFVYFGGDGVVMRFIPECKPDDRSSFLFSYLLLIFAILCVWLGIAYRFPAVLRLLLGTTGGDRFHLLILSLAPLPIVFAMLVAALKAMLDVRFSQILGKLLAIISLPAYATVLLIARPVLVKDPIPIVWGLYLGLMAVLGIVGAIRVLKICGAPRLRFYLPDGFWSYAFATEQVSAISFFAGRLDYVLILHYGGLGLLGRYVALMSVGAAVPMVSGFFMDTLFPSLTNMLASRNRRGAGQVFMLHMRTMFPVNVAMSCAIMLLAVPATAVLGPKYHTLAGLIIITAMCQGIANPGHYGGTLLASVGRQQLMVWSILLQILLFTGLFAATWHHWNLAGAVVAGGFAVVISRITLMSTVSVVSDFYPSIFWLWVKASFTEIIVGVVAFWWMPIGLLAATLVWIVAMATFLLLERYSISEVKMLLQTLAPGSWSEGVLSPIADSPGKIGAPKLSPGCKRP